MPAPPITVGDELPPFTRETGLAAWNRYAAVNDEFVPIHMDDEAGREAGYDTAFGMGNLQLSYLHCLLRQWVGEQGDIESVSCQFRAPNLKGQTVTAHGVVTEVIDDGARRVVGLEVWTEEQGATRLARGTARVSFPVE